jgi:hypothetical protein
MNPLDVLLPHIDNVFQLIFGLAFLATQIYQIRQGRRIEKQTNGLIASTVESATAAGLAAGENKGRTEEQARIAAKLALSDEVAAHLEEIKKHD